MFARMIDDFKESDRHGCAADIACGGGRARLVGHDVVSVRRGLCLRAAKLRPDRGLPDRRRDFPFVTLIAAVATWCAKQQAKAPRRGDREIRGAHRLADPMLVAAGIQVIRAIGVKRLIPILAVGGLALGLLASRNAPSDDPAGADRSNRASGHAAAGLSCLATSVKTLTTGSQATAVVRRRT